MKCVVLDGYALNPGDISWEPLRALGELTVHDRTPPEEVLTRCQGAGVLFTNKTVLSREVLVQLPGLRYIGVLATGYNIVDVDAARDLGIVVTNVPAYGTRAVSQFVFALLLEICHHVGNHSAGVRAGEWSRNPDYSYWTSPLIELAGKTMGIIGMGQIGEATARIAQAFGMEVLGFRPSAEPGTTAGGIRYVSLDQLYAESDVISLHCPLFDGTAGMINRESLSRMKDGVILINTSRGPLVVDDDLAEALRSGKVRGAGVDVLDREPPDPRNPLLSAPNCIVTPHIAWAPLESRARLMDIAAGNLEAFLAGTPVNVVNP